MKVLFICYANVGRSQVAHAYFDTLSTHDCESAGIAVNERLAAMNLASRKLKDNPNQSSVRYIRRELGRDIGEKEKQQLVPEMITTADLVVVIAEKERWPSYLHVTRSCSGTFRTPLVWLMNLPTRFIDKCDVGLRN